MTLLVASLLLTLALPAIGMVLTIQRGVGAADLVALAVLGGSPLAGGTGEPATDVGDRVAAANGARLVAVDDAGWPLGVHVEVSVPVAIPLLPDRTITAVGSAALRPPEAEP